MHGVRRVVAKELIPVSTVGLYTERSSLLLAIEYIVGSSYLYGSLNDNDPLRWTLKHGRIPFILRSSTVVSFSLDQATDLAI
jgi:hypothetical protein